MQCPSCQKEVSVKDKDVGALFTCPQCRSVYFINFDGTPEYGDVDQPSAEELVKLQNQNIPEKKKKKKKDKKDSDESEASQPEVQAQEAPAIEEEVSAFEMQPESSHTESFNIDEPEALEPVPTEALPTETTSIDNFSYESQQPEYVHQSSGQDFASIASEIESFGNEHTAVAGISYDLEISGLDTKESQELLREAIADSRFGWHTEDIVRQIRTGTCHLKDLTPVQAFVLARRIQFIDIDMKWKQNVLA
ncbi:hypothetical protein CIK05_01975 [Bdellovibrio sp. qaytius]|nr:hypothetical protein CIK05_01975 [Bdellovibrio sp. qaytius]